MGKKIKGLFGFMHNDIDTEDMFVVAEIKTGGESGDGYKGEETLGIAVSKSLNSIGYIIGGENGKWIE